jgi:hypothetical protein
MHPIYAFGSKEQKEKYLPELGTYFIFLTNKQQKEILLDVLDSLNVYFLNSRD